MTRFLLLLLLVVVLGRAAWRLIGGIVEGASGTQRSGPPAHGVAMARDPVCGTYVVPSRALKLADGGRALYFCSERCLSQYRARS